jgi:hypothetical protein
VCGVGERGLLSQRTLDQACQLHVVLDDQHPHRVSWI